jgi:hypothetical protein
MALMAGMYHDAEAAHPALLRRGVAPNRIYFSLRWPD